MSISARHCHESMVSKAIEANPGGVCLSDMLRHTGQQKNWKAPGGVCIKGCACLNCGKKIPENRKYCSKKCNKAYKRRESYWQSRAQCPHNEMVECAMRACSRCGWNPIVQQERIDKFLGGKNEN